MEDTFNSGELLYYWYDLGIVAPALAVIAALTIAVLVRTSWFHVFPLIIKTITLASTVMVSVVVLDRIGGNFYYRDPILFGYTSVGAAGVTFLLGIITLIATRGGTQHTTGKATGSFSGDDFAKIPNAGADFTELFGTTDAPEAARRPIGWSHAAQDSAGGGGLLRDQSDGTKLCKNQLGCIRFLKDQLMETRLSLWVEPELE